MDRTAIAAFYRTIEDIAITTTDAPERSGAICAMGRIKASSEADMEQTLKSVRDELFHHKGPLYDSMDQRVEMLELRQRCVDLAKPAINYCIKLRQAKSNT